MPTKIRIVQNRIMKPLTVFSLIMACSLLLGIGKAAFAEQPVLPNEGQPTIHVIVQTSTWKTRGRLLYDVEGSIRKKLSLAGFRVVHDTKKPHQYQLVVQYEEERGAQYGVELWGTTIHAWFLFRGTNISEPLTWEIRETSMNTVSGPAPYLDALLNFETHPHYFFLGAMLQKIIQGTNSQSEALTRAVTNFVLVVYPTIAEAARPDGGRSQDHYMENSQWVYREVALQRALAELVHQDIPDEELIPIAEYLLDSTDPHSRVRAVQILGGMQNATLSEKIEKLATEDPYQAVRQAAQQFFPL